MEHNIFQYILLGFVQGFTEPLPISSSGHLFIFQEILNISIPNITFEIFVNTGSLIAIIIYFWADLWLLIKGIFTLNKYHIRYGLLLITSTLPLLFVGILLILLQFNIEISITIVSISLLFTGSLLFAISYKKNGKKTIDTMTFKDAFIIGCGQTIAIIPGVSRSGMTIITGLFVGLKSEVIFLYSFMLYIPASIGAAIFSLILISKNLILLSSIPYYFSSFIIAIFATYIGLKLLRFLIIKNKFKYFAIYCWTIGIILLLFF